MTPLYYMLGCCIHFSLKNHVQKMHSGWVMCTPKLGIVVVRLSNLTRLHNVQLTTTDPARHMARTQLLLNVTIVTTEFVCKRI